MFSVSTYVRDDKINVIYAIKTMKTMFQLVLATMTQSLRVVVSIKDEVVVVSIKGEVVVDVEELAGEGSITFSKE